MEMETDAEVDATTPRSMQEAEAATAAGANGSKTPQQPLMSYSEELYVDSTCSSPFFSAPSSPGHGGSLPALLNYCYHFSAPTSPVHYFLASLPYDDGDEVGPSLSSTAGCGGGEVSSPSGSSEFEFSARFSDSCGGGGDGARNGAEMMCPADELFLNGQIRPMRLACHLERPQVLTPLLDLEGEAEGEGEGGGDEQEEKERRKSSVREDEEISSAPAGGARGREHFFSKSKLRSRSLHRRARSLSPLRTTSRDSAFQWRVDAEEAAEDKGASRSAPRLGRRGGPEEGNAASCAEAAAKEVEELEVEESEEAPTPSVSASSSRCSSSSSGRNSKRWIFLKDLLYRSKSEGRGNEREREIIRERVDAKGDRFWHNISFSPKDKAASLFVFSRAASKQKETKTKPSPEAATAADVAAPGAETEASSTDPERAPELPSAELTKQEDAGQDEKKKKLKLKAKPKLKPKLQKNDVVEEPGSSPAPAANTNNTPSKAAAPKQPAVLPGVGIAGKRRTTSAHERHYAAKRAQAEELRKRTFLPYRQGLLGCLGFSSRGYNYTAVSGLARTLNTVSSR